MSRRFVATIVLIVVVLAGVAFIAIDTKDDYVYSGGELKPAKQAAALDLTDQNGQPFTIDQLKGNVVLLYFGYMTCPEICPTTLSDFKAVKEDLGDQAKYVKFVMVTVDPERDTSDRLKQYLAFWDPEFIGLRGDNAQTEAVEAAYGVTATRVELSGSASNYSIDHTALIYVIDTEGRLKLTYPYGSDPALIAKDIEHLLS